MLKAAVPSRSDRRQSAAEFGSTMSATTMSRISNGLLWFPVFPRKTGRFPGKTGRQLSTNGQSPRGIRDLDDFSKSK
jgi:hypothetical protein